MSARGSAPNYDTPLSPSQEIAFRKWAGSKISDTKDYDLRGAWLANAKAAPNGHLPDTFKKPNHPTFSYESQYSTLDNPGGRWVQGPDGQWVFWASPANLKYRTPDQMKDYFQSTEPNALMILPDIYKMKASKGANILQGLMP